MQYTCGHATRCGVLSGRMHTRSRLKEADEGSCEEWQRAQIIRAVFALLLVSSVSCRQAVALNTPDGRTSTTQLTATPSGESDDSSDVITSSLTHHLALPEVRKLGRTISSLDLDQVYLDYYFDRIPEWNRTGIRCHGPPCHSFGPCQSPFATSAPIEACWMEEFHDPREVEKPPIPGCPIMMTADELGVPSQPNLTCMHQEDSWKAFQTAFQVFRLHRVFIHADGHIFNDKEMYSRDGCMPFQQFDFAPSQLVVYHSTPVLNWRYYHSSNYFHFLSEATSALVVGLKSLNGADVPVLANHHQWSMFDRIAAPLCGFNSSRLSPISTHPDSLHFAHKVYQPLFPLCGRPSKSFMTWLRSRHLLHPSGIPIFNLDRTIRSTRMPLSHAAMARLPSDWVVVLGRRHGSRSLQHVERIRALLDAHFGSTRVVEFGGSLPVLKARSLFRRARLYVAGHGAGLTNMMFMPLNSTVLEIRPRGWGKGCYRTLAYACSINFRLSMGEGEKGSEIRPNMDDVTLQLDQIHNSFR